MPAEGASPATALPSLSELLAGVELSGQTWCYCDLGEDGGFGVPHGDAVSFHMVLHGQIRLALARGEAVTVGAGQAVALLTGESHALRVSAGSAAAPLDFLRREQAGDVPSSFALGSTPYVARVLSGRMTVSLPPGSSRSTLPGLVRFRTAEESAWGELFRPDAFARAGIGPGSATLLTRLAAAMIAAELRADPRSRQLLSPDQSDPIEQALRLISGNPSANWTVERLARSVGMGRSNFAAHFTAQVGRAPMEVVAEQRMEHAAQLLRNSKLKIAEISELSGYGSEAAFSRRFTRNFGISPSQLREQARAVEARQSEEQAQLLLLAGTPRKRGSAADGAQAADPAGPIRRRVSPPARTIIFPARPD